MIDDGNEYRVLVEVPGAIKENLEISPGPVAGTILLKVEGREGEPAGKQMLHSERGFRQLRSKFERVIPVAWDAETARAAPRLENGLLTLVVPKKPPSATSSSMASETRRSTSSEKK